jgi:ADP-heptose:LPS heptosyltransferase
MIYHHDCRYFRGDIPCKPHKTHGYHCDGCPVYTKISKRILIIKLGAIGDVIRTTTLITKYRTLYPNCKITWLTLTPQILPSEGIDEILKLEVASVLYLQNNYFDIAVNLDKEKEAGALMKSVNAWEKYGYILKDGVIQPVNEMAEHKYYTGIFDDVSQANTKSYPEEIFEICGFKYDGEPYLLDNHEDKGYKWNIDRSKPVIGLNTGCGDRWTTRLWSTAKWIQLIEQLKANNYHPLLLGGEQEDPRNRELAHATGATYPGYFPLPQFINLVYQCDLVVTQVTMGMHIALGLHKKLVLMNNIFNPFEFDLFGKGRIVQPEKKCDCFYRGSCIYGTSCMEELPPEKVFKAVAETINF